MPGRPQLDSRRRRLRAAAAAFGTTVVLALGGCGGSDDSTEGAAATQSKEDFVASANAICARTGDELSTAAAAELQGTDGSGALKFITEVTLPTLAEKYDEIAALPSPEGEEEEVDAIVAAGGKAVERSGRDPELLLAPEGASTPFDEVNRLAGRFGIDQCAG